MGSLVAMGLSPYLFFAIRRSLRKMVATLKRSAGEYEIVRRTPPA